MGVNESSLAILSWIFYVFVDPNQTQSVLDRTSWMVLGTLTGVIVMNIFAIWGIKISIWKRQIKNAIQHWKNKNPKVLVSQPQMLF